jgi:hypothetical protein
MKKLLHIWIRFCNPNEHHDHPDKEERGQVGLPVLGVLLAHFMIAQIYTGFWR